MLNPSSLLVSLQDTPFNVDEETPRRQPESEKNTWRDTLLLPHVFSFFLPSHVVAPPHFLGPNCRWKHPRDFKCRPTATEQMVYKSVQKRGGEGICTYGGWGSRGGSRWGRVLSGG